MSTEHNVTPLGRSLRLRWPRWLWWWSAPTEFASPGPRISGRAYRTRLFAQCDNAIEHGAVDLATGAMFDQLIAADLRTDLCELNEELSRRATVLAQRKALHERRFEQARTRRGTLEESVHRETENLRMLDGELLARRVHSRRGTSVNGHRHTSAIQAPSTDEHR
ncbi:hypothetical protein [Nocardia brasiliensis]|uniref:hypothetical protein n=1 Tax=Nocardia brasiliensis TaxID=37326 RepID=UPI003D8EADC5